MSLSLPYVRRAAALCAVATLAVTLAGCAWVGAGRDVGKALQKTSQVKTANFSATIDFQISGAPMPGLGEDGSLKMTISGATDESNPANPRSWVEIDAPGIISMRAVEPGDGNGYLVAGGVAYGAPIDRNAAAAAEAGMAEVFKALEPAIGSFKRGGASVGADGAQLETVYAKGDAGKICDSVLPAFLDVAKAAETSGGSLKALTGDDDASEGCRKMLTSDPQLWFGIDAAGVLRMITVQADIGVAGTPVTMKVSMRFDIEPVASLPPIERPAGAKMLGSETEMAQAIAQSAIR